MFVLTPSNPTFAGLVPYLFLATSAASSAIAAYTQGYDGWGIAAAAGIGFAAGYMGLNFGSAIVESVPNLLLRFTKTFGGAVFVAAQAGGYCLAEMANSTLDGEYDTVTMSAITSFINGTIFGFGTGIQPRLAADERSPWFGRRALNLLIGRGNEAAQAMSAAEVLTLRRDLVSATARVAWLESVLIDNRIEIPVPVEH